MAYRHQAYQQQAYQQQAYQQLTYQQQQPGPPRQRFILTCKTRSKNYAYIPDNNGSGHKDGQPAFVAAVTALSLSRPNMTLVAGPDPESSPPVACANRASVFKPLRIGLGDALHAKDRVRWEDMKSESFFSKNLLWGLDLPSGKRVNLRWSPTKSQAVDGKSVTRIGGTNFKLVNADNPNDGILSVFTGQRRDRHVCGFLQINVDWGREFDYMVLISVVAMYDKIKQARRKAAFRAM